MGGYFVNLFNAFGRTWQVNLLAQPEDRTQIATLGQLKVRNDRGEMVPLSTLTEPRDVGGPAMVMRYNMYTSAPVMGNSAPGTSSGQAIELMNNLADRAGATCEWTEIAYLQILAGELRSLRVCHRIGTDLPGPGRKVRELEAAHGRHPGRTHVPALRGDRHADCALARRYLRADRLSGTGWPGREERHLDRRVLPSNCSMRESRSVRRSSNRHACDSGRS